MQEKLVKLQILLARIQSVAENMPDDDPKVDNDACDIWNAASTANGIIEKIRESENGG